MLKSPQGLAELVADAEDIVAERIEEKLTEHPDYIAITQGMRGWFCVRLTWTDDGHPMGGFYEPLTSSDVSYATREEAIPEAQFWAADEGVEARL